VRVFLDTNVLVSAFATRGLCADLLRHILTEHDLVVGEVVLTELHRVLRERMKVPVATIDSIEEMLREYKVVAKPERPSALPQRDPDDRRILASAIASHADVLVSGDADLLELGSAAGIRIMTPRTFWELLRGTDK